MQIVQFLEWKVQAPKRFFKLQLFRSLTTINTIYNQASRGFHWFCFFTPFDWSRKLTLASQQSNQMQSYNQLRRGHSCFPALTNSTRNWLLVMLIFVLIGRCNCLSYGFAEHKRKALNDCPYSWLCTYSSIALLFNRPSIALIRRCCRFFSAAHFYGVCLTYLAYWVQFFQQ